MSKLQKKPSALQRGHPTLQNMNFYKFFFLLLWVIVDLLDPDPDSEYGSGSTGPIEYGSNPDPDPKPWFCVGNFANLSIFTPIVNTQGGCSHIWMFTYQPPPVGRSQREAETEYVTRR